MAGHEAEFEDAAMRLEAAPCAAALVEVVGYADDVAVDGGETRDGAEWPVATVELGLEIAPAGDVGIEADAPGSVEEAREVWEGSGVWIFDFRFWILD